MGGEAETCSSMSHLNAFSWRTGRLTLGFRQLWTPNSSSGSSTFECMDAPSNAPNAVQTRSSFEHGVTVRWRAKVVTLPAGSSLIESMYLSRGPSRLFGPIQPDEAHMRESTGPVGEIVESTGYLKGRCFAKPFLVAAICHSFSEDAHFESRGSLRPAMVLIRCKI